MYLWKRKQECCTSHESESSPKTRLLILWSAAPGNQPPRMQHACITAMIMDGTYLEQTLLLCISSTNCWSQRGTLDGPPWLNSLVNYITNGYISGPAQLAFARGRGPTLIGFVKNWSLITTKQHYIKATDNVDNKSCTALLRLKCHSFW